MKNSLSFFKSTAAPLFMLFISCSASFHASAHDFKQGSLTIAHPYIRIDPACDAESTRAQVMLLNNQGKQADKLLAAELKGNIKGKLMAASQSQTMQLVPSIELPAGSQTKLLAPAYAIDFPVASKNFQSGAAVSGTLRFERAGTVAINYMIEAAPSNGKSCDAAPVPAAAPAGHAGHAGHAHKH